MPPMQIGFQFDNLIRFIRVGPSRSDLSAGLPQTPALSAQESAQLNLNGRRVDRIGKALNDLDDLLARAELRTSSGKSSVTSPSLGLQTDQTATRLHSAEEINTATTSYTPFGPEFTGGGGSDALPTLSGVYNGENGDNTLRFKVTRTGTHGEYVAGIRYKAWQPPSGLHPTIPRHTPLVFDLVDLPGEKSLGPDDMLPSCGVRWVTSPVSKSWRKMSLSSVVLARISAM